MSVRWQNGVEQVFIAVVTLQLLLFMWTRSWARTAGTRRYSETTVQDKMNQPNFLIPKVQKTAGSADA
jgi:hypothetical protein